MHTNNHTHTHTHTPTTHPHTARLATGKKSLKDFIEGRQRQFPRYYFVAEADLLDILSNGSDPPKILFHTPKIYLCTKGFELGEELSPTGRPIATKFVAGVGKESTYFEPPVALEGKVEIYMQVRCYRRSA